MEKNINIWVHIHFYICLYIFTVVLIFEKLQKTKMVLNCYKLK